MGGSIEVSLDVPMPAAEAFDALIDQLTGALDRRGVRFEPGPQGRVTERGTEIARVGEWRPGERLRLEWVAGPDAPAERPLALFTLAARGERTTVTFSVRQWHAMVDGGGDAPGWFVDQVAAPLLAGLMPQAFGDWVTDRGARRPTGPAARGIYADPLFHYPNFRVILEELDLRSADRLLEIGCGGGALLGQALQTGCRAAGIDHSLEMVRLARASNAAAVADGRLQIVYGKANALPFRDGAFTCATMTGVLGFLTDPVGVLADVRRTLAPGGRMVVLGSDERLRGTPAAPEPMASRLHFYDDAQLAQLGRDAGFAEVRVIHRDLEANAREVGVPEPILPLFAGPTAFLLLRNA